jgi:uncharacterized protein (DUF427 family)
MVNGVARAPATVVSFMDVASDLRRALRGTYGRRPLSTLTAAATSSEPSGMGSIRTEPIDKWVRGYVGATAVVDTRRPLLFWEETFPVPGYAFAVRDVRMDLLHPASGEPASGQFFFRPKGPVSQWFDLHVGDRLIPHAAWSRDDPALDGMVVMSWQPGLLDRWLEEDEEVRGHPRDPHKRVEAVASSRRVKVELDGVELASTDRPVLLFETDLPTRYYLPRADVHLEVLTPNETYSLCPYKGETREYWSAVGPPAVPNVAWSYWAPLPVVQKVAGLVAFYNELVDLTIDGVVQERPVSPFSEAAHRPGS